MNPSIESAATRILQNMQRVYGKPSTRTRVDESGFAHLDLGAYRRIRAELEAEGFVFVQDCAIAEINESPITLMAPTMVRSLVSDDGHIVASYFQVRPRWKRLWGKVFTGLRNGRWIGALKLIFKRSRVRHCVEFSSELGDGRFLSSSNAQAAEKIGMPFEFDRRFHKTGTPWGVLLAEHRWRLAEALADGRVKAVASRDVDELEARFDRESALKRLHRERMGWITHDELVKMSDGNVAAADAIHAAIRAQLDASASPPGGPDVGAVVVRRDGGAAND